VSYFDIESYQPRWLTGRQAVTVTHGRRLRELLAVQDQPLRAVELLQWTPPNLPKAHRGTYEGSVAVSFVFETGHVTVLNALDENGLELGRAE
jgi:hypothetical protein